MNNKRRLLAVLNYLKENSDENHPIKTESIIAYLNEQGMDAERKTIYNDVRELCEMGHDIESSRQGFFYGEQILEDAELRILIDLIKASSFLSKKKSAEITDKLLQLTNRYARELLVSGKYENNKSQNEQIYYNITSLIEAIARHQAVSFRYFDYTVEGTKMARRHDYRVLPYDLIVNNDRYYLIGLQTKYNKPVNYRLDKMEKVELVDEYYDQPVFDVGNYMNETFNMYGGQKENVTLKCANHLYSELVNQFGKELLVTEKHEDYFLCNVNASLSPTFYSWIFTFDGKITILSPDSVRKQFRQMCERLIAEH